MYLPDDLTEDELREAASEQRILAVTDRSPLLRAIRDRALALARTRGELAGLTTAAIVAAHMGITGPVSGIGASVAEELGIDPETDFGADIAASWEDAASGSYYSELVRIASN